MSQLDFDRFYGLFCISQSQDSPFQVDIIKRLMDLEPVIWVTTSDYDEDRKLGHKPQLVIHIDGSALFSEDKAEDPQMAYAEQLSQIITGSLPEDFKIIIHSPVTTAKEEHKDKAIMATRPDIERFNRLFGDPDNVAEIKAYEDDPDLQTCSFIRSEVVQALSKVKGIVGSRIPSSYEVVAGGRPYLEVLTEMPPEVNLYSTYLSELIKAIPESQPEDYRLIHEPKEPISPIGSLNSKILSALNG